ncbi:MAG: hypothetical protein ACI3W8_07000 [Oscillospiraceae bacterium]
MPTQATNTTPNYHLSQWEENDRILREDFNADNAAIEAALLAVKSEAAEDLQAMSQTLSAAIGSGGKTARIVHGSYTGTGGYGASKRNSLTLDFKPLLVFLTSGVDSTYQIMMRPFSQSVPIQAGNLSVSWGDLTVSWYCDYSSSSGEYYQCNVSGGTYHYTVIGVSV